MCDIHTPNCLFYFLSVRLWTSKFWKLSSEYSEININSSRIIAQPVPDFSKGLNMGVPWRRTCDVLQLPTSLLHCSTPRSWGNERMDVSEAVSHWHSEVSTDHVLFSIQQKKGVKMLLLKTACGAPEEKEDLPLILFPGLNVFWGLRAAVDCMHHVYCTGGVKGQGQAMSVVFAESSYSSQSKHVSKCPSGQARGVCWSRLCKWLC